MRNSDRIETRATKAATWCWVRRRGRMAVNGKVWRERRMVGVDGRRGGVRWVKRGWRRGGCRGLGFGYLG